MTLAAAVGWFLYVTRSARIAVEATRFLAELTGAQVQIESARFGFDGVITLRNIELRCPDPTLTDRRVFSADEALIKHSFLHLLRGRFMAQQLTVIRPVLYVTQDLDRGAYTFELLEPAGPEPGPEKPPVQIPNLLLRGGYIRFGQVHASRYEALGRIQVDGKLLGTTSGPHAYAFTLHQDRPGASGQDHPVLRGHFDLSTGGVQASLDHLKLEPWQGFTLPHQVRPWWERLSPRGDVPRITVTATPAAGTSIELEVRNAQLTLPYTESAPRMTGVSGRLILDRNGLAISDLEGTTDDFSCRVNGKIRGFAVDSPMGLTIETGLFKLPDNPGYLSVLPVEFQDLFAAFSPSGQGQAEVTFERRVAGGPITYRGRVRVIDASSTYHRFPYPLTKLNGLFRFTDQVVEMVEMHGYGPTGARLSLSGQVSPLGPEAAVNLVVKVQDLAIDDALYQALPPRSREILDLFLDRRTYQRFVDQGLIRSSARRRFVEQPGGDGRPTQKKPNPSAVPVFDLGGKTSALVKIQRPYGRDQEFQARATIPLTGVNMMFKFIPYPVRLTGGHVAITPDQVFVETVGGQGVGGGHGHVKGRIDLVKTPEPSLEPDLELVVADLPCDALFKASLPDGHRQTLENLALTGTLYARGDILSNEHHEIDYRVKAQLRDGRAVPFHKGYVVEDLEGTATLSRQRIEIHRVEGRHGSGRLAVDGTADWRGAQHRVQLAVAGRSLTLERELLDLLPSQQPGCDRFLSFCEKNRVDAVVDARLGYDRSGDQPGAYHLEVQPVSLSFDHHGHRIELDEMTGSVAVTTDAVQWTGFGGSFGAGVFSVDGQLEFEPRVALDLTIDVAADHVCDTTRAVLPRAVNHAIDKLRFDGGYRVQDARLTLEYPLDPSGAIDYLFDGCVGLENAQAHMGVHLKDLTGDLTVRAEPGDGSAGPKLGLRLEAGSVLAGRRRISPLTVQVASTDQRGQLAIREILGGCYGGTLVGSGGVRLGPEGGYEVDLTLQGVAVGPFLHPDSAPRDQPSGPMGDTLEHPSGVLSANLSLEGSTVNPGSRRGRGQLEIHGANLYDVPLAVATLQLMNLTLPTSRSFEKASARYLVQDDVVYFDLIQFYSRSIEIIGTGTMAYSNLGLNLDLFTRNPTGPEFGPLSDLYSVFKDELVSIRVTGTLDDPKPKLESFKGVKRSWRDVFGSKPRE